MQKRKKLSAVGFQPSARIKTQQIKAKRLAESREPTADSQKGLKRGGQQIENRQSEADAKIQFPPREPLPTMWPAAGRVPEIWHLSHLLPKTGRPGFNPRRPQRELVIGRV